MAEYFDSRENAEEAVKKWQAEGAKIAFFAKVRTSYGDEKWMVDFRKKDYQGAITVLEDLLPTLKPLAPELELACSNCRKPYDKTILYYGDQHYKCMKCRQVILCKECRTLFSGPGGIGCPICGYHERWNDISP